jgi:hypothetical protein
MRVLQIHRYHRTASKFMMMALVFYFLFFVSITPFAYGLMEEINIELEMSESFEDIQELTEEFLKAYGSGFQYPASLTSTHGDINEQFLNSYKPDIPFPPPKTT